MICTTHGWTTKSLPCPNLRCPNGTRGLWIAVGKKQTVYIRRRDKDERGPRYFWEKTDLDAGELLHETVDDDEEDLVF